MIICRKPLLYDVDLLGLAGLVLSGLAAWWFVVAPWQDTWARHAEMAARHAATESRLHTQFAALEQAQAALGRISACLAAETGKVPRAAALSALMQEMTDLARTSHLDLLSVAPQPAAREGSYVVTDIVVVARGRSHDLVAFLSRFAERNPHQALRKLSVTRPPGSTDEACELGWTVRLYTLPDQPLTAPGVAS